MSTGGPLTEAESAYEACSWAAASTAYAAADMAGGLPAQALERWGLAAYLAGLDEQSDAARERAFHAFVENGDFDGAARVGHWLGVTLFLRGEPARGGGWHARVQALLDDNDMSHSVWRAFLDVSHAMRLLFGGDPAAAAEQFERLAADAPAYGSADLDVLTSNGLGQSLIAIGRIDEGLRRLDHVMVAVTSNPDVSPQVVGLMYCAAIDAYRRCFDHARAREWTEVLSRWCGRQSGLVPYRGQCLVHRAEVLQLHGMWSDANIEMERVFHTIGEDPTDAAAGMAHYQRGELHRLRGEFDAAEAAYRRATQRGRDPQPGLALLRAAQGQVDVAYRAIRRALEETALVHERLRLLPAYAEVALAAADLDAVASATTQMRTAVTDRPVPLLAASAAQAEGQLALARGDAAGALPSLREALTTWQALAAPYDAAATRVQIALACRMLGDDDTADMELDAARWAFDELGATPALARVNALARGTAPRPAPGGLTPRESQILRLVATGATNRAIAGELFLSEKTVARHVANIFLKLDVGSRAAATAFAYEHHLV